MWLDSGKSLTGLPWLNQPDSQAFNRTSFYPTIQVKSRVALKSHRMAEAQVTKSVGRFAQSSSLLHLDYGKTLDHQLMSCDPFYAMQELFLFCAFSEMQFLNMLESKISAHAPSTLLSRQPWNQSNLLYSQQILEFHADRLRENLETIKVRGGPSWPRPSDTALQRKSESAAKALERDYEHLLERIGILSGRCQARMNVLMNKAMIAESNKAIIQAEEVTKLTRLAFVYIPISFTASFFGMNLEPLVNNTTNSIWLWFVVSMPVLVISLVVMKWDLRNLWKKLGKSKHESLL